MEKEVGRRKFSLKWQLLKSLTFNKIILLFTSFDIIIGVNINLENFVKTCCKMVKIFSAPCTHGSINYWASGATLLRGWPKEF